MLPLKLEVGIFLIFGLKSKKNGFRGEMQENILKMMLKKNQTVFSFKELLLLLKTDNVTALTSTLNYYVKKGDLHHIRRGLYAKSADYNRFELATKILTPSYVSFETVLRSAGIIFQYYSSIFVASYQSREIICDGQTYNFRAIKPTILTNSQGIEILEEYSIASPERAFLDVVYRHTNYHFDNLAPLNWDKVYEILPIYGHNKRMHKRVALYHDSYKKSL